MNETIIVGTVATPAGIYHAACTQTGLGRLAFPTDDPNECLAWARRWAPRAQIHASGPLLDDLAQQLTAYFEGRLRVFELPLDLRGTPFQMQVWREVLGVRYGEVRTYAEIAAAIGKPQAYRAVGAANGANPIPIVVPCHRLIGANGSLIKYGGGLDVKRQLLALEGVKMGGRPSTKDGDQQ
jgi:O-6-methylguanine DNA methyltransferase